MRSPAWDGGIGTGIPAMDAEHRLQASLVNALEASLRRGEGGASEQFLRQLLDFTSAHFQGEEQSMRLRAYPRREAHGMEHARLLEHLRLVERSIRDGDPARAAEAISSLRAWLVAHVRSMDQSFALWCAERAMSPAFHV
jgi:hemerythrin-like metal-binding protein